MTSIASDLIDEAPDLFLAGNAQRVLALPGALAGADPLWPQHGHFPLY